MIRERLLSRYATRGASVRPARGVPGPWLASPAQGRAGLRRWPPGSGLRARRRALRPECASQRPPRTAVEGGSSRDASSALTCCTRLHEDTQRRRLSNLRAHCPAWIPSDHILETLPIPCSSADVLERERFLQYNTKQLTNTKQLSEFKQKQKKYRTASMESAHFVADFRI